MDNFLPNGAVLPSGLLGVNEAYAMAGFNKAYRNTQLRMGIVVRSYPVGDPNNILSLTTEYDVLVFEQCEDKGSTIITYRNCMATEGMGSVADFWEKTLRVRQQNSQTIGTLINTTGQNGAVVLIQCLDGVSEKALIVGAVTHPNRNTTLVNDQPYLQGEYNGINVKIDNDGSTVLTFRGATDNDGNPTDATQGDTVVQIETDGSFQINHKTITFRLDKDGTATLTTSGDADLNVGGDANITVTGDTNVTSQGKAVITASEIDLNGSEGQVLTTVTDPVIDTIFGTPTIGVPTVKAG